MTNATAVIAARPRGLVALLRGWAPFVGLLVAYELMRDLASVIGVEPHNLAPFDRHLFDGYEPTLVLQAAAAQLADRDLLEDAGSLVYGAHFLLPIALGAWLWAKDRDAFNRFGFTLVILCAMAFATYVVAPTSPPWLAQPSAVRHVIEEAIQRSGLPPSLLWLYSNHDYNLYAAFPSLHAGFPVVAAAAAWQRNRVLGALLYCWAVVVWLAVVYLGEHYVTDVVGGIAYAALAIVLVRTITARLAQGADAEGPGSRSGDPSLFRSGGTTRSRSSR
jgi:membrane-associated phospholipid phosphatase